MVTVLKRPDGAGFWSLWVLASLAALELAFLVTEPVAGRLLFGLSQLGLEPRVAGLSLIPVRQAIAGAALGLAQWLILRRRIEHVGRWPVATTIGAVLSAPLLIVIALAFQLPEPHKLAQTESLAFAALNGSATGICVALGQLAVLGRRLSGAHVWLAAGLVGYALGAVSTMALSVYAFLPFELNAAATGGILGAVTGLALRYLFGRAPRTPALPGTQTARASSG